jgi:hypothetical protein
MMRRRPTLIVLLLASLTGAAVVWQGCAGDAEFYPCGFDPVSGKEILCCESVVVSCMDPDFYKQFSNSCDPCIHADGGTPDSGTDAPDDAEGGPPAGDAGPDDAPSDAPPDAPSDAAAACAGECVDAPPVGWSGLVYLWSAPSGTPFPSCPADAPIASPPLFANLVAPPASCGACSCDPPTGTCSLPTTFTASSAACNPGGGTTWSFDPPAAWAEGVCTNSNPVSATSCAPGPCVKSLTAGPLGVQDDPCGIETAAPAMPTAPPAWQTSALACKSASAFACADPSQACAPVSLSDLPAGFAACVSRDGDWPCPDSFPTKLGTATGFDDQRACSPCTCGAPAGSSCSAQLHVYADDTCMTAVLGDVPIGSDVSACFDLTGAAGTPLGSKYVDKVKYHPGTCAADGGQPMGQVTATGVATFCCLM